MLHGSAIVGFYVAAAVVIWLGVLSLRGGFRFAQYVRNEMSKPHANFAPFASVIAPTRGLESGLLENITALFEQHYPAYEIIFVTDRADDPSLAVIQEVTDGRSNVTPWRTLIAGEAVDSGQKVHNLIAAVAEIDPRSKVLVFVDTDARVSSEWLKSLIAPLDDQRMGAASGYRWFLPVNGGLASHLRSVWNASIASSLGENAKKNFCWGGSTAIRRENFDTLRIRERWRGTVSDDFTITRVLQKASLPIQFVPACLVPSLDGCTTGELFEFTNRQLKITRVYAPHLWWPVLIGSLLFTVVFFGGLLLVIARAIMGIDFAIPLLLLVLIYAMGGAKSYMRLRAVAVPLKSWEASLRRTMPAHLLLWPIASALYLWNAVAAGLSRRIDWRGISYELKSDTEAVIIRR